MPSLRAVFSPDNKLITIYSFHSATVWNAANGQLVTELIDVDFDHINGSLTFSPDSKLIVITDDTTAKIWNASTGELAAVLGHTDKINSASFSPDGKWAITASDDSTAGVWNAVTGQLVAVLKPQEDGVKKADFSPDGKWIVTVAKKKVRVWNAVTLQVVNLILVDSPPDAAIFSSDGKLIFTTGAHGVEVWNALTGALIVSVGYTFFGEVVDAAFSRDGKWIVTNCNDSTYTRNLLKGNIRDWWRTKVWSIANGSLLNTLIAEKNERFTGIDVVNNHIISINNSETSVYDMISGQKLYVSVAIDSAGYLNHIPSGYYMCTPIIHSYLIQKLS